jgi:hypothetical protein
LKRETILGVLLFLLSLSLAVVPIIAAFSAHDWDPKATLLGESNPIETRLKNLQNLNTQNMVGDITLDSIDDMNSNDLINYLRSLSLDELNAYKQSSHSLNITVQITSPLDFPIKIKTLSGNLKCNDHGVVLASVQLAGEVSFASRETKNLSIIGTTTQDGITDLVTHLLGGGFPTNIGIEDIQASLDIYGIILEGAFGST